PVQSGEEQLFANPFAAGSFVYANEFDVPFALAVAGGVAVAQNGVPFGVDEQVTIFAEGGDGFVGGLEGAGEDEVVQAVERGRVPLFKQPYLWRRGQDLLRAGGHVDVGDLFFDEAARLIEGAAAFVLYV